MFVRSFDDFKSPRPSIPPSHMRGAGCLCIPGAVPGVGLEVVGGYDEGVSVTFVGRSGAAAELPVREGRTLGSGEGSLDVEDRGDSAGVG